MDNEGTDSSNTPSLEHVPATLMHFAEYAHDGSAIPRGDVLVVGDLPHAQNAASIEWALREAHLLWNHLEEEASLESWEVFTLRYEWDGVYMRREGFGELAYLLTPEEATKLAGHAEFLPPRGGHYRAKLPMLHDSLERWLEEYHGKKLVVDRLVDTVQP